MASLMELRQANQYDVQQEQANNPLYQLVQGLGAGFNTGLMEEMKAKKDEQRRQDNVKKQLANAQAMMQQMAQYKDNSANAKAVGAMDNDQQKRMRGVIKVDDMVPEQEMSVDETGALNLKMGFRKATPQEQKAQFETQKAQMDMQREEGKRSLLDGYVKGELQEGAILKGMQEFGITKEEFDVAVDARSRMNQLNATTIGQPKEEPFKFKRPLEEQKFAVEQAEKGKAEQEKVELAKANAESALGAINEIRQTMGHFGMAGNVPALPGTDKVTWSKNIDRVKAMLTLENLMALKNASKTGASGMGALSDGERKMLEDAASALDKGLPKEKAEKYLGDIERTLTKVLGGGQEQDQAGVPQVGGMFNGEKVLSIKRIK